MEGKAADSNGEEGFQKEAFELEMNVGEEVYSCLKEKGEVRDEHLATIEEKR